jgi:hypothetical protein
MIRGANRRMKCCGSPHASGRHRAGPLTASAGSRPHSRAAAAARYQTPVAEVLVGRRAALRGSEDQRVTGAAGHQRRHAREHVRRHRHGAVRLLGLRPLPQALGGHHVDDRQPAAQEVDTVTVKAEDLARPQPDVHPELGERAMHAEQVSSGLYRDSGLPQSAQDRPGAIRAGVLVIVPLVPCSTGPTSIP